MTRGRSRVEVETPRLMPLQAESWRLLWRELVDDAPALAELRSWSERRRRVRPEVLDVVHRFVEAAIGLAELRDIVAARARAEWEVFGFRARSGAMFLHQVAGVAHGRPGLVDTLRYTLRAPADTAAASAALRALHDALTAAAPQAPQATRAVSFLTQWWSVQAPEQWPPFQPSARAALREDDGLYAPRGDAIGDYERFRPAFLAVARAVRLSAWEVEFLTWWRWRRSHEADEAYYDAGRLRAPRARRDRDHHAPGTPERVAPLVVVRERGPTSGARAPSSEHTRVQWLLATLGRRLGFRVWIAANDHARQWHGESLGGLSVPRLPSLGIDPDAERVVALIDVVWLRGAHEAAAAFEVEHTTSVHSGLLRLADLAALSPNLSVPLYIVAPRARLGRVRRELLRPAFRALGLPSRCAFFASESLVESAEAMMRWGHGTDAVARLAERVEVRA